MIIIDSQYLAYRALHTTGDLSFCTKPTGTMFGFLIQLQKLRRIFPKDSTWVFAWDSRQNLRKKVYSEYKAKQPKQRTKEEEKRMQDFYWQLDLIQKEVLEPLGFGCHLKSEGYEADDIIAGLCRYGKRNPQLVKDCFIVSSDHDLYQLLDVATMFLPHTNRNFSAEDLWQKWGITPDQWAEVLAIAGCDTDGVPGVVGVGFKTACQYLTGKKVKASCVAEIERAEKRIIRNRKLVTLPFAGKNLVPIDFRPEPFRKRKEGIAYVQDKYGFKDLEKML